MTTDPRLALEAFVNALHEHLAAAHSKRSSDDLALDSAYQAVANAFEQYEDALYDATGEVTPLDLFDDEDDDDDESLFDTYHQDDDDGDSDDDEDNAN